MTTDEIYTLPDLGYALDALEPAYSADLLELHYTKHHQAYVDSANANHAALQKACKEREFGNHKQLLSELAFNVSGHLMHTVFWQNISPIGSRQVGEILRQQIDIDFAGFDALREQFLAAGTGVQGSGWAVLSWEPLSERMIVQQVNDHQDNAAAGSTPLLVLDMWEHAFYLQYRNDKKRWANAFWDLVNWQNVERRLLQARAARPSIVI
jgi:Fe-Mn family superoxide dismutase